MGIYGVVGSIVSMFAVFSGGMGNAVQRFLTYEIGRDNGDPNKVFCSCLNVIFLLSGIIFILLEVGGLWFLRSPFFQAPISLFSPFPPYSLLLSSFDGAP